MFAEDDWFDAPIARRARRAWRIALVCYLVPIMVATHWPRLTGVGSGSVDKFIHFVSFGALAWAFMQAAPFRRPILNLALGVAWVYLDEITQSIKILGRTFSVYDMTAGWLGCAVAGLVFWAIRARAPRGSDERLDDLAAERVLFACGREWARAGATTAVIGGVIATVLLAQDTSDAPILGKIVFPVGLGLLVGAVVATAVGFLRAHARVARGDVDAWTGGAQAGRVAIGPGGLGPLVVPTLVGALLAAPATGCVWLVYRALFGAEPGAELAVDFDGFMALRPTFIGMLACAGAVATASVVVRARRARRGFRPQRHRA